MVAYRLVDLMRRASAANILGITVREFDNLIDVFELSEKFTSLRDPSAAITWARELMGVSKKLLTPSVVEAVVKKVNQKRITNSKVSASFAPSCLTRWRGRIFLVIPAILYRRCRVSVLPTRNRRVASPVTTKPSSRRDRCPDQSVLVSLKSRFRQQLYRRN